MFLQETFGSSVSDDINTSVQNNNYLSFSEFICGLAACEPQTPHGDAPGEARCRYIFRYYDKVKYNNTKQNIKKKYFAYLGSEIVLIGY